MFTILRDFGNGVLQNVFAGIVASVLTIVFSAWIARRHRIAWQNKVFKNCVHFSVTTFDSTLENSPPLLIINSLCEKELGDIVSDPTARSIVEAAVEKTTAEIPFLDFHDGEATYVMAYFQAAIAEICKAGTIALLIPRVKVSTEDCVFAVTYERYPGMLRRKIRVIIVNQETLKQAQNYEVVQLEETHQSCRLDTLRDMARDSFGPKKLTKHVRINFPR